MVSCRQHYMKADGDRELDTRGHQRRINRVHAVHSPLANADGNQRLAAAIDIYADYQWY